MINHISIEHVTKFLESHQNGFFVDTETGEVQDFGENTIYSPPGFFQAGFNQVDYRGNFFVICQADIDKLKKKENIADFL